MLRPGIAGMRGSMVVRLRLCMTRVHPPLSPPPHPSPATLSPTKMNFPAMHYSTLRSTPSSTTTYQRTTFRQPRTSTIDYFDADWIPIGYRLDTDISQIRSDTPWDGLLILRNRDRKKDLYPHLTQVHDDGLVDLLPQVSSEDLDEGDLQRWDLAVHENACQVKLHLRRMKNEVRWRSNRNTTRIIRTVIQHRRAVISLDRETVEQQRTG